ncbi:MAG: hypothetical protein FWB82_03615 [Treponema sp.]|nr:hypothetical protein [Treponema sp.]
MAKISNEERYNYLEKIKPYKATIQLLLKREQTLLQVIKRDSKGAASQRLILADEMIFLASNYIVLGGVSQSMLKQRSEEALNDGRKSLYKAVIYLEEVVSPLIDAPFSEYEERLGEISTVDAQMRYDIVRKLGLAMELLESAYGDNTKWRWAFVELEGRYAAVAKNIIDLKSAVANTDPRSPDYEPTVYHLRLMKRLLLHAATRYREKYELSTNRIDDFKMGVNFLNALKRVHILLGERDDAETIKKKAGIWSSKLELDMKKQDEAALKRI